MKKIFTYLIILLFAEVLNAEPPRKPFVVLRINGKEYKSNEKINVRPGERLEITAVLLGGRRDYCSNPQKYANVGRNTVITNQGENGMSFYIGDGTFRGTWTLISEKATFTPSSGAKISEQNKNSAILEIPQNGFGQVFVKVHVTTKWHYDRHTQAGSSAKDETNEADGTFYFVIQSEEGVWYSSANITAKGTENFSVRNSLDLIQQNYDEIYKQILQKNFSNIQMYIDNLKNSISDLKTTIDNEKSKNPDFECEVTFHGLPTSLPMQHLKAMELLSTKWKEQYIIAQENIQKINELLPKVQNTFSANVLKSVFKNYINWGTSIPTSYPDFLTLYDPSNTLTVASLPAKVMGWWQDANNDASILQNQIKTIQMLSQLRNFYLERIEKSTEERKKIEDVIKELKPIKELDNQLTSYFNSIGWANFVK